MVLAGLTVGLTVTVYGSMRRIWRLNRCMTAFGDWIWFLIVAAILVVALFLADWGQLRFWSLAMAGVGVFVWILLADPLVAAVCRMVFRTMARTAAVARWPVVTAASGLGKLGDVLVRLVPVPRRRPPKPPASD